MMHGKIDLNLFFVLKAVYEEESITAAAKALHLTQPAVSHAMSRLRDKFDDELFVRHSRRMVPTPLCQSIIQPIKEALAHLESTLSDPIDFDISRYKREIRLGLRDILESTFLPAQKKLYSMRNRHKVAMKASVEVDLTRNSCEEPNHAQSVEECINTNH